MRKKLIIITVMLLLLISFTSIKTEAANPAEGNYITNDAIHEGTVGPNILFSSNPQIMIGPYVKFYFYISPHFNFSTGTVTTYDLSGTGVIQTIGLTPGWNIIESTEQYYLEFEVYTNDQSQENIDLFYSSVYLGNNQAAVDETPPVITTSGIYLVDVDNPVTFNDIE